MSDNPNAIPTSGKSSDWLNAADKKLDELKKESSKYNILGKPKLSPSDPWFKAMSDKENLLRNKGMKLKRMGK
jgi:hypothetical protein